MPKPLLKLCLFSGCMMLDRDGVRDTETIFTLSPDGKQMEVRITHKDRDVTFYMDPNNVEYEHSVEGFLMDAGTVGGNLCEVLDWLK